VDATHIQFAAAPANGVIIEIRRVTSKDVRLVDCPSSGILRQLAG
jgi:hypothetical protein